MYQIYISTVDICKIALNVVKVWNLVQMKLYLVNQKLNLGISKISTFCLCANRALQTQVLLICPFCVFDVINYCLKIKACLEPVALAKSLSVPVF